MLRKFLMDKMIKSQLKGVPQEEQDRILNLIERNPEFFEKIAKEIQDRVSQGKDQTSAAMEVMMKYKDEVQKLMGN